MPRSVLALWLSVGPRRVTTSGEGCISGCSSGRPELAPCRPTVPLTVELGQIGEHRIGIGYLQPDTRRLIAKARLNKDLLDQPISHVHRIPPAAQAHSLMRPLDEHPHQTRELSIAVWQHGDVLDIAALGPLEHDER